MPIDLDKALGAEIHVGTRQWDADKVILYHLGIGAGVPATDAGELEYTYEKNLKVLPSFAVIPGAYGGPALLQMPGLKIDIAMLLHGEHDLELSGPVPKEASADLTVRIKNIYDKGKAALVVMEAETKDASGATLFYNRLSLFIRGEGGFGGDSGPKPANEAPDRAPDRVVESPTLPQQGLLYRLNGDKNPLHVDPEFSKLGGFDTPILHGLCTYGIVCKAVVDSELEGEPDRVARYQVRFAGVVYPGETIVTSMWREGERILIQASVKERNAPAITNAAIAVRT